MLDLLQHYFGVNSCYLKYSSIPVPRHWDPENLILYVKSNVHNEISWIPISDTGMTTYRYWNNTRGIL
ncbi:MAG: WPE palindromic element domain-containing protein [Wolbachia sp.]